MNPNLQEHLQDASAADAAASNVDADEFLPRDADSVSPLIARSLGAFRQELPSLIPDHFGEWVAYQGDRRLGFSTSKTQLYQECFSKGLKRGEFIVECVEPEVVRETELFLKS